MPETTYMILPLTKGPQDRIGPHTMQDWWRGLVVAVRLLRDKRFASAQIYVISDVHILHKEPEVDTYIAALHTLGVRGDEMVVIRKAQETIEQLHIASGVAAERNLSLIIISTFLHYPRVRWICWRDGIHAKHYIAFGIPRPAEALRDILLWFLFPIVDLLGKRQWLITYVTKRRYAGKH